ncbi:hypothetical protein JCM8097_004388 [Rhodosporidiobolus ruineniae]
MQASISPRRHAAGQLMLTCGGLLVFFLIFAAIPGGSHSQQVREHISNGVGAAHRYLTAQDRQVERFSWHQCLGGAEWGNEGWPFPGVTPVKHRHCHFKNVCVKLLPIDHLRYDTETNYTVGLTYYKSPLLAGGPEIWSTTQSNEEPWLMTDRDHYLLKTESLEPMPKNRRFVKEPTVIMGSFWPQNFGHALGDDSLPAFRLLRQYELVQKDNYYVFHQSCKQRGGDVGCKNERGVMEFLTTKPYQEIGGELFPDADTEVCFADVVMGPNEVTMRRVDERAWPDMIQHMKRQAGIKPNGPIKKHKVVIIEKHGRRTWLNFKEVREHIEKTYGVETILINPAAMTVKEQMALLDATTVLVTPPGGASFSSEFLHKGATAVFAEWWSERDQRSYPMDQEIYTWNADLHPLFYPLTRYDLTLDRSAIHPDVLAKNTDEVLWQGWSNVTINLPRLDVYLRAAFVHSSQAIGIKLPPGLLA